MDDSATDVFLVREAIASRGLNVELHVLDDGEQAAAWIDRIDADGSLKCPQLVLLDLNLPRMSGLEVLARIRRSSRCGSTPVLIVTSSDSEKDRAETAAGGATAYFRKPSGYEAFLELGSVIRGLLG